MILSSDFTLQKYGLFCRFVEEKDAEFILKLRTDPILSRYLHATENDVEKQILWIKDYKIREKRGEEYYFIFYLDNCPIGLNRIYNIHDKTFTTGSWLFSSDAPFECSIAASIIVREVAFEMLGLEYEDAYDGCHIDNKKVMKFNHMMGLKDTGSYESKDGKFITQSLTIEDFAMHKPRMLKLIGYK